MMPSIAVRNRMAGRVRRLRNGSGAALIKL